MKNKKIIVSLLLLLSFSLPGCVNNDSSSFSSPSSSSPTKEIVMEDIALKKAKGVSSTFLITSAEQLRSITRYEDAIVFVSQPNCIHCNAERKLLSRYIKENEVIIYEVEYLTYKEAYLDESNNIGDYMSQFPTVTRTPTYLFYKEGKFNHKFVGRFASSSADPENYFIFKTILESYSYINNFYMLNDFETSSINDVTYHSFLTNESVEETSTLDLLGFSTTSLDQKIKEKEKSTILFIWRRCGDCKSLRENILDDFFKTNPESRIYYYEVDGYYLLKRQSEENLRNLGLNMWSSFSTKYHLYNEDFYNLDALDNKAGYVPTFVTYQDGAYQDMEVYLNESKPIRNEDGTLSFTMAFHEECKQLKSDTIVDKKDTTSAKYQKALQELYFKAMTIDITKANDYLKDTLL